MKPTFTLIVLLLMVGGCGSSEKGDGSNSGKNRLEIVNDTQYRSLNVNADLEKEITEDVVNLTSRYDSLTENVLFWKSEGQYHEVNQEFKDAEELIKFSYDLWKTKDITSTVAIYKGHLLKGDIQIGDFWVVEVEHSSLTGTCRFHIDPRNPSKVSELGYTDRN